ncbi:IS110 family transposase [bacterium]|nr:IS110 family transposase [bacterium]
MSKERSARSFEGQVFKVGLDVHLRSWTAAVRSLGIQLEKFSTVPSPEGLIKHMQRRYPEGTYEFVYEAGCCGFWIQRRFAEMGFECIVANPGDVATNDKERRGKSDPRDAAKLAREFSHGDIDPIYVPAPAVERFRQLVRCRERLVSHSTRLKQRIKGYLALDGITPPSQSELCHWSSRFISWIEAQFPRSGRPECLELCLEELRLQRGRILTATRAIRRFVKNDSDLNEVVQLLRSVPGVGFIAAVVLASEIADVHRFPNFDRLNSFAGLGSDTKSSGERERNTGLTSRRNRYMRHILIEAAWVAIRKDPELFHTYSKARRRMKSARAILPVARRLLSRIRAVWSKRRPYRYEPIAEQRVERHQALCVDRLNGVAVALASCPS